MRLACIQAVSTAEGRQITQAEAAKIEGRILKPRRIRNQLWWVSAIASTHPTRSDPFIAYENIKNKMSNAVSYILLAIDKETK